MEAKDYTSLNVWLQSRQLVKTTYELTRSFPKEELWGLTSQMRRAAVSIPSNIAEGCGRQHSPDTIRFLFIARGSLFELETQFYLASDLEYLPVEGLQAILQSITNCKKLVQGFIRYHRSLPPLVQASEEETLYLSGNKHLTTDN